MFRSSLAAPAAAVLLTACGSNAPTDAAANNAQASQGDYIRQIRAMPQGQRLGVMFRAIRDAGGDCQQVTTAAETPGADGPPTWLATCTGGGRWLVTIDNNGVATVMGAPTRSSQG